jgi:hypothetical protein
MRCLALSSSPEVRGGENVASPNEQRTPSVPGTAGRLMEREGLHTSARGHARRLASTSVGDLARFCLEYPTLRAAPRCKVAGARREQTPQDSLTSCEGTRLAASGRHRSLTTRCRARATAQASPHRRRTATRYVSAGLLARRVEGSPAPHAGSVPMHAVRARSVRPRGGVPCWPAPRLRAALVAHAGSCSLCALSLRCSRSAAQAHALPLSLADAHV